MVYIARTWLAPWLITGILAHCQCGYSARYGIDEGPEVFTHALETDFFGATRPHADDGGLGGQTEWLPQEFSVEKEQARGEFGEKFQMHNVKHVGPDDGDGNARGMELVVSSTVKDGMISVAEVDSKRSDIFHGTFRAAMKLTSVSGTCAAFFWYHNDTQEIDMEFLSREFDTAQGIFPVNLVLQSKSSAEFGHDGDSFSKVNLPFDPTADFHEYRMDFLEREVIFYADGQVLTRMKGASVPTSSGHIILGHWSNGNKLWSGGPPDEDGILTVSYVKAYFNSSDSIRTSDWELACGHPPSQDICEIPDIAHDKDAASVFLTAGPKSGNETGSHENYALGTHVYGLGFAGVGIAITWLVFTGHL